MASPHSALALSLLTAGVLVYSAADSHAQTNVYMSSGTITTSSPQLAPPVARKHLARTRYALKTCYTKQLKRHASLKGNIVARFTVNRAGDVIKSRATGIKHDVAGCIARTISTIQFPKPNRVVRVRFSFDFARRAPRRHVFGKYRRPRYGYGRFGHGYGYRTARGIRTYPRAKARFGKVVRTGQLSAAIIRRYLRLWRSRLRSCYSRQLLRKPKLRGRVVTSFVIGPGGKVIKVTAAGLNRAVATCVERVVKQMRFPKPRGAGVVKVRFPTNFTPVGPVKRKP